MAAVASFSLSLIPLLSNIENNVAAYIIAAVFWSGLLLTFVVTCLAKKSLYQCREKMKQRGYIRKRQFPGIFHFSSHWKNIILYTVTVLGLVLIVTDVIFGYVPETVMFPVISVTILSFIIHCVIDGKYYKAYQRLKEIVKDETNR